MTTAASDLNARIAAMVADLAGQMGVTGPIATVVAPGLTGDADRGDAITYVDERVIMVPAVTARMDDSAVRSILAHEVAHLAVEADDAPPVASVAATVWRLASLALFVTAVATSRIDLLLGLLLLVAACGSRGLSGRARGRRIEIECDIMAAHVSGRDGVVLAEAERTEDPLAWVPSWLGTHPSGNHRAALYRQHSDPARCGRLPTQALSTLALATTRNADAA